MNKGYANDARIFKALCDEKRLMILELLRSGEKCACALIDEMNIAQSAVSYHMKILCESNIVKARQDGKWTHYSLNQEGSEEAAKRFVQLTTTDTNQESTIKVI